jgi:hypothetical protein
MTVMEGAMQALWSVVESDATALLPCRGRWRAAKRRDGWGAARSDAFREAEAPAASGSTVDFGFAERAGRAPHPSRLRRDTFPYREGKSRSGGDTRSPA